MMMDKLVAGLFALLLMLHVASASAEQAVELEGGYGLFNKPPHVVASVVLIPGGNGYVGIQPDGSFTGLRGNQLVRTRAGYASRGIATMVVDARTSVASAVSYLARLGRPVAVVATSRGTLRIADALTGRPSGIVLTSGMLASVQAMIGSTEALPRTLIVHHRQDGCRLTPPDDVASFARWGGSRIRVAWIDGGNDRGDPCEAAGHHGFAGRDDLVVATIATFVRSLR